MLNNEGLKNVPYFLAEYEAENTTYKQLIVLSYKFLRKKHQVYS